MVASAINYLLYPFLSRILTAGELGDVGIILNVVVQAGGILLAFNLVSIYLLSRNEEVTARKKIEVIQSMLLRLCIYLSIGTILLFPLLKHGLKIESYGSLAGMLGLLFIVIPAVTWTGYIQGKKSLGVLGIYNIVNAITKTIGAVLLALIGLKATGAIFGFGLGFIISLLILWLLSPYKLPNIPLNPFQRINASIIRDVKGFVWSCVALTSLLSLFYSIDLFSAKILLNQYDAGVYIGLSTLAGAVYFLIMTVAWIIIPNFSKHDVKHNQRLMYKCAGGAMILTLLACTAFWWQGHSFILIALGDTYANQSSLLWLIALSQGIIGLVSMLALFSMIRGHKNAPAIAFIMCFTTISSVATGQISSASALIKRVLIGELLGVLLVSAYIYVYVKKRKVNE